jgi:cytochrome b subunit of formate dehydrogenase
MRAAVERVADVILKILYWVAVLAISLALVVGLILFFESRDQSSVERSAAGAAFTSPA